MHILVALAETFCNAPNSSSNGGRTRKLRQFPSRLRLPGGDSLSFDLRERYPPYIYLRDLKPPGSNGPVNL